MSENAKNRTFLGKNSYGLPVHVCNEQPVLIQVKGVLVQVVLTALF